VENGLKTGNLVCVRRVTEDICKIIPLGRPRLRWEDNIRKDLQDVGCGCVDWIGLAQDRDRWRAFVSVVMNLRVP
jgi:hypothetical protein